MTNNIVCGDKIASDTVADTFTCHDGVVKVVRNEAEAPRLLNELECLKTLRDQVMSQDDLKRFPLPVGCGASQGFTATVYGDRAGYVPLSRLVELFPGGLDPRDAAWMMNRTLVALALAHGTGLIHAAVLPEHILINPDTHAAILDGWYDSTNNGGLATGMVEVRKVLYPVEVIRQKQVTPATDTYMWAATFALAMGTNLRQFVNGSLYLTFPDAMPLLLRNFVYACTLPSPYRRYADAWELHEFFNESILKPCFGPPAFRPFTLPS